MNKKSSNALMHDNAIFSYNLWIKSIIVLFILVMCNDYEYKKCWFYLLFHIEKQWFVLGNFLFNIGMFQ